MSPSLALVVWFLLLVALLRFESTLQPKPSPAMWLAVLWIFIVASRQPSQWLDGGRGIDAASLEEGNALDRTAYLFMTLGALVILVRRTFEWRRYFTSNPTLTLFMAYCLLSVAWSDFPFIAFKRWFRDLGPYLAILVALSDPRVADGGVALLRRVLFLAIPLSIVMNKYYDYLAKEYDQWTGRGYFVGVTTSKNMLGVLCLVGGIYFFWDILARWHTRKEPKTRWIIRIDTAFLVLSLILLVDADSATSRVCLLLGCIVISLAHSGIVHRRPRLLTIPIPILILTYALLEFVLGINIIALVAEAVGRSPDLTGRTYIWSVVLSVNTNPLVGTGYESFWLGPRLDYVWQLAGHINHAHNGYLEIYLNLGFVGLGLIVGFLLASYRTICRTFRKSPQAGSLALALWTVLLFYNVSEAALRGHLLWIVFVLFALLVPRRDLHGAFAGTSTGNAHVRQIA